jgi:hypothetical protein
MAILVECPRCYRKQAVKDGICLWPSYRRYKDALAILKGNWAGGFPQALGLGKLSIAEERGGEGTGHMAKYTAWLDAKLKNVDHFVDQKS